MSTITLMAVVIAVLSTMLVLGIVMAFVICVRRWNRESRGWWKVWRWRIELRDVKPRGRRKDTSRNGGLLVEEGERRPLLDGDGVSGETH